MIALTSVYFAVLLDALGAMMVMPLLPFLATRLQASAFEVGFMQSFYSLMQIVGTFVLGAFADSVGKSKILLVSLLMASISLIAFAFAQSLWQLILFRGMNGFFAGTIPVCQAIVTDVIPEAERPGKIALIMAAYGLGVVLGPLLAAVVSPFGFSAVSLTAAGLTMANFLWSFSQQQALSDALVEAEGLQTPTFPSDQGSQDTVDDPQEPSVVRLLLQFIMSDRIFTAMCIVTFLQYVNIGVLLGICALFVRDVYGMGGSLLSGIFCIAGVAMVFSQAFVTSRAVEKFGQDKCIMVGSMLRSAGFALLAFFEWTAIPWIAPTVIIAAGALIDPCTASRVSAHTPVKSTGLVLGAFNSVGSFGSFVGPVAAGALYGHSKVSPFWLAAALSAACAPVVWTLRPRSATGKRVSFAESVEDTSTPFLDGEGSQDDTPPHLALHDSHLNWRTPKTFARLMHMQSFVMPTPAMSLPERYSFSDESLTASRLLRARTESHSLLESMVERHFFAADATPVKRQPDRSLTF